MSFYDFVFVYGTLRPGMDNPLRDDLARLATVHQKAYVLGHLYDIADYPGLVHDPESPTRVTGEILKFARRGPLLRRLDDYEDCGPRSPKPHPYERRRLAVHLSQTRTMDAWVYVYVADISGKKKISGGDYPRYVQMMQGPGNGR